MIKIILLSCSNHISHLGSILFHQIGLGQVNKINKIIFIISKAFIPNDSILVSCSNIIGYSDIRLGYAAIPVYCIGKNIKFDEIKKLMKWTLPKSSLLFTPEQI